jgi:hypothetical protein
MTCCDVTRCQIPNSWTPALIFNHNIGASAEKLRRLLSDDNGLRRLWNTASSGADVRCRQIACVAKHWIRNLVGIWSSLKWLYMTRIYTRDALLPPLCRFILLRYPCSAEFMKHFLQQWLVCSLSHIQIYNDQNYLYCQTVIFRTNEKFIVQMPTFHLKNLSLMKKYWAFWLINVMGFQRIKYFEIPYCLK